LLLLLLLLLLLGKEALPQKPQPTAINYGSPHV
jgi:hypothetical protein